jgi:hypothetical protein
MRVKEDFFQRGHFKVGDAAKNLLLGRYLIGQYAFSISTFIAVQHFPKEKNVLIAILFPQTNLNIGSRRTLSENKWNDWLHLCHR